MESHADSDTASSAWLLRAKYTKRSSHHLASTPPTPQLLYHRDVSLYLLHHQWHQRFHYSIRQQQISDPPHGGSLLRGQSWHRTRLPPRGSLSGLSFPPLHLFSAILSLTYTYFHSHRTCDCYAGTVARVWRWLSRDDGPHLRRGPAPRRIRHRRHSRCHGASGGRRGVTHRGSYQPRGRRPRKCKSGSIKSLGTCT